MTRFRIHTLGIALPIALCPLHAPASGNAPEFLIIGFNGVTLFTLDVIRD